MSMDVQCEIENQKQNRPDHQSSYYQGEPAPVAAEPQPPLFKVLSFSNNIFRYEELERATNGFSEANFLGKGGFGSVHKGVLQDGREVAIKQLEIGGRQRDREFQAEVEIITRVHHRHLVTLVGYCITGAQRMLVYDFVANNSLNFHLHEKGRPTMKWSIRLKIALGSAKGLAYLHADCHPRIIHSDIKSDNILLDHNWEAKISDFGLARIFPDNETHIEVSWLAGTFGYFPPEYGASGELTAKSDVYFFGVILLELITGRLPPNLVAWVKPFLEEGDYDNFVDPRLTKDYNVEEMTRLVKCAAACVRLHPKSRPSMTQVHLVLGGDMPVDCLNEDVAAGNKMHRFSTLNPAILVNGAGESGPVNYYSTTSGQEQGNGEENGGSTVKATLNSNSSLLNRESSVRRVITTV